MAHGGRRFVTAALAAGATSPNLLADDTLRYPGDLSSLEIAATTEAIGLQDQLLVVEVGNEIVYSGILPVEAIAGRGPILPDDILVRTGVAPGDQVAVRVTNEDAVATPTSVVLIDISPA